MSRSVLRGHLECHVILTSAGDDHRGTWQIGFGPKDAFSVNYRNAQLAMTADGMRAVWTIDAASDGHVQVSNAKQAPGHYVVTDLDATLKPGAHETFALDGHVADFTEAIPLLFGPPD